ncbi:MAG: hypothetical protein SF162_11360 [bacterium]|nr:hypothetical protein [bacterium]
MGRLWRILATAIAISFGLVTLAGLLIGDGLFNQVAGLFLQLAAVTIGLTILIGLLNLYTVHLNRLLQRGRGSLYSLVMLASAALVIGLWLTNQDESNMILLESVQVALESALAGLVLFALVYGAYRFMRGGVTLSGLLFTAVLLIVLLGTLPGDHVIAQVRNWVLAVPVSAGQRGILLGIALATVVTGVRVLAGQDRNYRE